MRILIGFSRCPITVSILRQMGHEAWTCDLLPAQHPYHLQGDIWSLLSQDIQWDWGIFHPMCRFLTVSAAWAFKDPDFDKYPGVGYHQKIQSDTLVGADRRAARTLALEDFRRILKLPFPKAIENPARSFICTAIRPPDQTIHPYEFGDDASKATGLWLDRMPPLVKDPSLRVQGRMVNGVERFSNQTDSGQNRLSPSADRWLERSATYPGIARAFGYQWGEAMKN